MTPLNRDSSRICIVGHFPEGFLRIQRLFTFLRAVDNPEYLMTQYLSILVDVRLEGNRAHVGAILAIFSEHICLLCRTGKNGQPCFSVRTERVSSRQIEQT